MRRISIILGLLIALMGVCLYCPAARAEYAIGTTIINGTTYSSSSSITLYNPTSLSCTLNLTGSPNASTVYTARLTVTPSGGSPTTNEKTVSSAAVTFDAISLTYPATYTVAIDLFYAVNGGTAATLGSQQFSVTTIDGNSTGTVISSSRSPAPDSTGVSPEANITFKLDRLITTSTVNSSSITLLAEGNTTPVNCSYYASNDTSTNTAAVTVNPNDSLIGSTKYTITVLASGLKNQAGNSVLAADASWSFTTETLQITNKYPSSGDDDFPIDHAITFNFNQEVYPSTITSGNIYLETYDASGKISAVVTYDPSSYRVTLKPSKSLEYGMRYRVCVTSGVKDEWGKSLTDTNWSFYTQDHDDDSSLIYSKDPSSDERNVSTDQPITFRFSTRMDEDTIDEDTVYLRRDGSSSDIDADIDYDEDTRTVTLTPEESLRINTEYTIYVSSRIEDYDGERIDSANWSFKTGNYESSYIKDRSPSSGEDDVPLDTRITIEFSDGLKSSTVKTSNIYLRRSGYSSNIKCDISYDSSDRSVTLAPLDDLLPNTTYNVYITSKVEDTSGNKLSAANWSFTTADHDLQLIYRYPEAGTNGIPLDAQIRVGYSMPLTASTVNSANCTLTRYGNYYGNSSTRVPIKASYDAANRQIIIKPSAKLAYNTEYSVTIGDRVKDYTGNFITKVSWNFTTTSDPTPRGTDEYPIVKLGDKYLEFTDELPYTRNGRTMVPFRTLLEALGATVDWNSSQQKITAKLNNNNIELYIGKKTAYKNSSSISLETAPELRNHRAMIPLRFVSEALGKKVSWDQNTCTVIIK